MPSVTPMAKAPEVRPTGTAATVNGQAIPEVAVYRALRQFPEAHREMARKEIMSHLIENALIDQYLTALKVTVEEKDVEKLIADLKKELADVKKDYAKELEVMMLTEAEFRTEVVAQMKWEEVRQAAGHRRGAEATVRQQPGRVRRHDGPRPPPPPLARHRRGQAEGGGPEAAGHQAGGRAGGREGGGRAAADGRRRWPRSRPR